MAAPRTWVTAELVTATIMNGVRDQLSSLAGAKAIVVSLGDTTAAPLVAAQRIFIQIPVGLRVVGWSLVADNPGFLVLDVWRSTFAAAPPTVAGTIAGSEKPTLSGVQKAQDLSLTTWTTDINANEVLAVNVDSNNAVIKQAVLTLQCSLLAMV